MTPPASQPGGPHPYVFSESGYYWMWELSLTPANETSLGFSEKQIGAVFPETEQNQHSRGIKPKKHSCAPHDCRNYRIYFCIWTKWSVFTETHEVFSVTLYSQHLLKRHPPPHVVINVFNVFFQWIEKWEENLFDFTPVSSFNHGGNHFSWYVVTSHRIAFEDQRKNDERKKKEKNKHLHCLWKTQIPVRWILKHIGMSLSNSLCLCGVKSTVFSHLHTQLAPAGLAVKSSPLLSLTAHHSAYIWQSVVWWISNKTMRRAGGTNTLTCKWSSSHT